MPFNGAGTFVRLYNWTNDASNGIDILASRFDAEDNDFANALSNCITRDGQGVPITSISWNGQRITNLGSAIVSTDAVSKGYVDTATLNRNMNGFQINNVAAPTNPGDAANMAYVQSAVTPGTIKVTNVLTLYQFLGAF